MLDNIENENNIQVGGKPVPPAYNNVNAQALNIPASAKTRKKIFDFTDKDTLFFVFIAVASFFFMRLGVINLFNFGASVTYTVITVGMFLYTYSRKSQSKPFGLFVFSFNLVLAFSLTLHDNYLIKFITLITLVFSTPLAMNSINGTNLCTDGSFMKICDVFYTGYLEPIVNLDVLFGSAKVSFKNKNNKLFMILGGALVSVPMLAIIIPLLSSADEAFNTIVGTVLLDAFLILLSLVLTFLAAPFVGSYAYSLSKGITSEKDLHFNTKPGKTSSAFLNTFLCITAIVYVAFLVSQLAYISDTFAFLLPEDFSASQFARSGFFQMCAISLINLLIVFVVSGLEKPKDNGKNSVFTRVLLTFFVAFSLFLTANAFIRMSIYIKMYGLTQLRVLTSIFMIMLAVIFIFALIRVFNPRFKYINFFVVTCLLTVTLVSVVNIDSIISKYNYRKYTEGEIAVDFDHYNSLGCAAVPELLKLSESDDYITKINAQSQLISIAEESFSYSISDEERNGTQTFNYEKNIFAYNRIHDRAGELLEKFFDENRELDYDVLTDYELLRYNKLVEENEASNFLPEITTETVGKCEYISFYADYYTYTEDDSTQPLELTMCFKADNYESAVAEIKSRYKFSQTFEYNGYNISVVDSDEFVPFQKTAVIVTSDTEKSISYLYFYDKSTTEQVFEDLPEYIKNCFSMYFLL